jgi:hypothetical protein
MHADVSTLNVELQQQLHPRPRDQGAIHACLLRIDSWSKGPNMFTTQR